MREVKIRGRLGLVLAPDTVDSLYAESESWLPGRKMNRDSRLALLGVSRLLSANLITPHEMHDVALIVAVRFGSLESYQTFEHSMHAGQPDPVSYTHALQSTAASAITLRHQIRGPVLTSLTSDRSPGKPLALASSIISSGQANIAIALRYRAPSLCKNASGRNLFSIFLSVLCAIN